MMSLIEEIKHKAIELGFELIGITEAAPIDADQTEWFEEFLSKKFTRFSHNLTEKAGIIA
jgi:epoxyqueuosine reductase QueG